MATEQDIRDLIAIARQAILQSYSQAPDAGIAILREPGEVIIPQYGNFGGPGITFNTLENATEIVTFDTFQRYLAHPGGDFIVELVDTSTGITREVNRTLPAFSNLDAMDQAYYNHDRNYRIAYLRRHVVLGETPPGSWISDSEYRLLKFQADMQLVRELVAAPVPTGLDPISTLWSQVYRLLSIALFGGVMPAVLGLGHLMAGLFDSETAALTDIEANAQRAEMKLLAEIGKRPEIFEEIDARAEFDMRPGETIGHVFGASLANAIGSDDPWVNIIESTALSTIGQNVGSIAHGLTLSVLGNTDIPSLGAVVADSLGDAFPELAENFVHASAGALSAFLTAELVETLGVDGLAGEVLATTAGSAIGTIVSGIATGQIPEALNNIAGNAVFAVGSFFGSKLASEVVETETNIGAIGAQVGAAVGTTIAKMVLSAAGSVFGPVGYFMGSLLGGFFGQIIGGLLGDLFGDPPEAWAAIEYNREHQLFEVGVARSSDGGSKDVARQLASAVVDQLNGLIGAIGALNIGLELEGVEIGYIGDQLKFRASALGPVRTWSEPEDVLADGVLEIFNRMTFEGGDAYIKRALAATAPFLRTSPTEILDGATSALMGAVLVGASFDSYRNNKVFINALISDQPDTAFSLTWISTLLSAAQLGVDRRHANDWLGGWSVFNQQNALAPEDAVFSFQDGERRISRAGADPNVFVWWDTVDPTQKTRVEATGTPVQVYADTAVTSLGVRLAGSGTLLVNGEAFTGDVGLGVAMHIVGSGFSDRLRGGDQGNDFEGGAGDDLIFGGDLDDWILGGEGNDTIYTGNGDGDYASGGDGDDRVWMGFGSGVSDGGSGNDLIIDRGGNDIHRGGEGDDDIRDFGGSDVYLYNRGDGIDSIIDSDGSDTTDELRFGNGILPTDVSVRFDSSSDALTLVIGPGEGDEIRLSGQAVRRSGGLERIVFSNGVIWERSDMLSLAANETGLTVLGTSGADALNGDAGDDVLEGAGGADTLRGGGGSDTYIFSAGDGSDVIIDTGFDSDIDVIMFGTGIAASDVRVARSTNNPNDLLLTFIGSSDSIIVTGHWAGPQSGIEQLRFSDGLIWTRRDLDRAYLSQAVTTGDDIVVGFGSDDAISGGNGNDDLSGGKGYDVLNGAGGSDTYRFNTGDGLVRITDSGSTGDRLVFGVGIQPTDVRARVSLISSNDLELSIGWNGDVIILTNYLGSGNSGVEFIEFADSTVWARSDLPLLAAAQAGTSGDDYILGSSGADILASGRGWDWINGLAGADTYIFNLGDGFTQISDSGSGSSTENNDVLQFGAGINPTDVKVRHNPDGSNSLILTIAGTADQIYLSYPTSTSAQGIDFVNFDGGAIWTRAQLIAFADANVGLPGDDIVSGATGAQTYELGPGDDAVIGSSSGSDTYIFNRGDGHDVYVEGSNYGNTDRVVFGEGIAPSDLRLSVLSNGTLTVHIEGTNDSIRLTNQNGVYYGFEQFVFEDGTVWNRRAIWQNYLDQVATPGNDLIYLGSEHNLTVRPGGGDDRVDTIMNTGSAHTIVFKRGDGRDHYSLISHINAFALVKIEGYALEELKATILPSSRLLIEFDGSPDSILIDDIGGSTFAAWDTIAVELDDGTRLYPDQLYALAQRTVAGGERIYGFSTRDVLFGTTGTDELWGRGGDDLLDGGAGSDTYRFNRGEGQIRIHDSGPSGDIDRLVLGAGIAPEDILVLVSPSDTNDAILIIKGTEDQIYLDGQYDGHGVEEIAFSGGPVWGRTDIVPTLLSSQTTSGDDFIVGTVGADSLSGGAGNDRLEGGEGADIYEYAVGDGHDIIADIGGDGDLDILRLSAGISASDITATWSDGDLLLTLAQGGSIRLEDQGQARRGIERVEFNGGGSWTRADLNQGVITAQTSTGDDEIVGGSFGEYIAGGAGNDLLRGGGGSDIYYYAIGDGADTIIDQGASSDIDTLRLGPGIAPADITIVRSATDRTLWTLAIVGGGSVSFRQGLNGDGIELLEFDGGPVWNREDLHLAYMSQGATSGADVLYGDDADNTVNGGDGDDTIYGEAGDDVLQGGTGNDTLYGDDGDDTLLGGDGDDVLIGGAGIDTYDGGAGNDTVDFSDSFARWTVDLGAGTAETIEVSESLTSIENVIGGQRNDTLIGDESANLIDGQAGDDVLEGHGGNDRLDGGAGDDTMIGGEGDDTYVVDSLNDVIIEEEDQGVDGVESATVNVSIAGVANVENITLLGSRSLSATGNELDNVLVGNAGSNRLDGGAGADTMIGGLGDDSYVVDSAGDVIVEASGEGIDTVEATISYSLAADPNLEIIILLGSADLTATGNSGANTLVGNAGANRLDGGAGADTMSGGAGDDIYVVDDAGDIVNESSGEGNDTIEAWITYSIASLANVENITLMGTDSIDATGNAGDNILIGNGATNTLTGGNGADRLDGGAGADTIIGGAGNDTYVVDDIGDTVVEGSNAGNDTVESSITFTIASLANVENITLLGGAAINATGNNSANILIGNNAANTLTGGGGADRLDGGAGADTMIGGTGNDVYVVDDIGDSVVEVSGGGTDRVESSISFSIASLTYVENITLTGTANIDATGNNNANILIGNSGDNILDGGGGADRLDGGAGADTMIGGAGNDVYVVDNVGDAIVELSGGGTDTVESSITFSIAALTDVEHITLMGNSAINATGNAGANTLTGNAQANELSGADGNDRLVGGAGNDTLDGGDGTDRAVFSGNYSTYSITTTGGSIQIVDNAPTTHGDDGTDTLISIEQAEFRDQTVNLSMPIILDLNGDGVTLTRWDKRNILFDWNGDGVKDRTGWFGASDGILALDRNGDGLFSGAHELTFVDDAPGARSDLEGLRAFDSNADGVLDASDARWSQFYVWQDANGDALVDQGEWRTLEQQGVLSINLNADAMEQSWADRENIIVNTGVFTTTDGAVGTFADAALVYETGAELPRREQREGSDWSASEAGDGKIVHRRAPLANNELGLLRYPERRAVLKEDWDPSGFKQHKERVSLPAADAQLARQAKVNSQVLRLVDAMSRFDVQPAADGLEQGWYSSRDRYSMLAVSARR
ncbi:calcium-binding protein [Hyphomonas polymorpha]|uniref:calcium-binding protein n=1 Tax=Hyphomonas polymorpha TaxID=74319 RepID=UPI000A06BBA6|nr:calcium-binding protein [Hyphomonas polymorpha]